MKMSGRDVKTAGALPEKGAVFPEFSLLASDNREVTHVDFDGRSKVFFFCEGPEHEASAKLIVDVAHALDEAGNDVVLIPVARTAPVEWRRFLSASGLSGVAPLSVGSDVAVPFPVFTSGDNQGALAPGLVFVDDQDEVKAIQLADDADTLAGLDLALLLKT